MSLGDGCTGGLAPGITNMSDDWSSFGVSVPLRSSAAWGDVMFAVPLMTIGDGFSALASNLTADIGLAMLLGLRMGVAFTVETVRV